MEKDDEIRSSKELPLQIIELEILRRLPAKCLGRCICVCKQWKSIISTREFIKMNLHNVSNSLTNHKFLRTYWFKHTRTFRKYTITMSDCEAKINRSSVAIRFTPSEAYTGEVYILGSIDGLVCVSLSSSRKAALWNPLTGAYKMFSFSSEWFNTAFGFYYDSFNNDYKLLLYNDWNGNRAYIYSPRSDSRRKIRCFEKSHPCISNCFYWSHATFLGESLYFILEDMNRVPRWIVVFDVKSEKFRGIQFPPVPSGVSFCGRIVVVKDCIHVCVSYKNGRPGETCSEHSKGELWKMMDGDCWRKVAAFCNKEHYSCRSIDAVYVTRNGDSQVLLKAKNHSFNVINIEDLAANFCVNSYQNSYHSKGQTIYVESLVSPNC